MARVPGATLFLQAVQDVQIGGRAGNAQFQYTLQGDNFAGSARLGAASCEQKLRGLPQLRDVNSDLQNKGLQAGLVIDRDTASRLGITADVIDNTLYDAFGQRQVSTMYENINQYYVVMEIDPQFQQSPDALKTSIVRSTTTGQIVPMSAFTHYEPSMTSLTDNPSGPIPRCRPSRSTWPRTFPWETRWRRCRTWTNHWHCRPRFTPVSRARRKPFRLRLAFEPYLILAALVTVYIVLGDAVRELSSTRSRFFPRCPPRASARCWRLLLFHTELSIIALIGIILLIGIVKKNAILMIDFAIAGGARRGQ